MALEKKGSKRAAVNKETGGAKKLKVGPESKPVVKKSKDLSSSEDELDESSSLGEVTSGDDNLSSEDELDDISENGDGDLVESVGKSEEDELDESDSDNDDVVKKGGSKDEGKKTSSEAHAEQRKLLAERKLQRKSGVQIQRIKSLWERLRVKKQGSPKQVRDKLSDEIWELSKDVINDLVLKHDASRIVQTLVKYSSKERRLVIAQSLKGSFYPLATSSYGKYLLVKLLHYGSKEVREMVVNELHGKLRKLMRHKEGAYVVEDLYVLYSSSEQKKQMIREFWGAEYAIFKESGKDKDVLQVIHELAEKKQLIMSNLIGTITASVEKGSTGFEILHAAMQEYIKILVDDIDAHDQKIRDFIELLGEQIAELVHTEEGSSVACTLIALANAKERKVLIKSLRSHAPELIKNEYGNLVLITLYLTVDDTVLVHKAINSDLYCTSTTPKLIQDKFSRRPLLYLLKGLDGKYFSPLSKKDLLHYEELAYKKTSKKPQDQRRAELLSKSIILIYESILETTKDSNSDFNFTQLMSNNMAAQFLTELILNSSSESKVNETLRPELLDAVLKEIFTGDVLEDHHLINKVPFISRSLKALIQGNEFRWDSATKKLKPIEDKTEIPGVGTEFAVKAANEILESNKLEDWTSGQGAFVVVSLYEVLELLEEKKKFKELQKALKNIRKNLQQDEDNKGSQLLLKLIK